MGKKRRVLPLLLAVLLFFGLSRPMTASASAIYFTSINDSVAPLTADTMPYWSGGVLYVPYTVFSARTNGIGVGLGLDVSYNRSSSTVAVFNLKQMLVFDMNSGICRDEITGTIYNSRAIMRNGKPYVALNLVCSFFGMNYSYNQISYIPQGYLVRIKGADTVLDDATFIDVARRLFNDRLRDYTQSLNPTETTTPTTPETPTPSTPPPVEVGRTAAYLAFRCESADGLPSILNTLDGSGQYALFFLSPQLIWEEGDLVRRMLGTGHSVGILAPDGEERTLIQGRKALEELAHTRTTLAYVPDGARAGLEGKGWVCWKETLLLKSGDVAGLNRLGARRNTVYLTLESGGDTALTLPTLLRRLDNNHYTVSVPMETKL